MGLEILTGQIEKQCKLSFVLGREGACSTLVCLYSVATGCLQPPSFKGKFLRELEGRVLFVPLYAAA